MSGIEEIADILIYRPKKCWECPFGAHITCSLYERHWDKMDTEKPPWCRVDRIRVEFEN